MTPTRDTGSSNRLDRVRLIVDDLACRRSGRRIFAGLSFAIERGGALLVTGRNGAGKSSLLAMLAGRLRPDQGAIRAEEISDAGLSEHLHVVGHRDALKSALTAQENLEFARDLLGGAAMSPRDALDLLALPHVLNLPVAYLSAGQRRRVALARLLVCRRPLWLLDEPTAALDGVSQSLLMQMIEHHRREGGLVVATTHQPLGLDDAQTIRIERLATQPLADDPGLEDWL